MLIEKTKAKFRIIAIEIETGKSRTISLDDTVKDLDQVEATLIKAFSK